MRRHALLVVLACLLLSGCPQDRGARRSAATTLPPLPTTTTTTTTTTPGGPGSTQPGAPGQPGQPGQPGEAPEGLPRAVLLGGAKLVSVDLASGTPTELEQPPLGNGLQVVGLLDRPHGVITLVRGPLPQDAGAAYVLGDSEHLPRLLGTGVAAVAGAGPGEAWIRGTRSPDGLLEARRVDIGREAPPLAQRSPAGRVVVGVGAGGLVTAPEEGSGRVELLDPVRGSTTRALSADGVVLGADGQRAVVLDGATCPRGTCEVVVAGPAGDRRFPLPAGLVPERGAAVTAGAVLFVARQGGGVRHLHLLRLTSGEVVDVGVDLPPEAGPTPMAADLQGGWAFLRSGAATLVGVRLATAEATTFPFQLEPWQAIAVTAGGACACAGGGTGGPPPV